MSDETLKNLVESLNKKNTESGKGFGLCNVHQRLRLNYGPSYGLRIESRENIGTKVFIVFPALENQERE
jgi:two-component system sensor histidine kinase YesM